MLFRTIAMNEHDLATGFLWFLAFLFSTTVHEAMHAWAAMKGGDLTAYHGGQVSLSPIPHIQREPIGMLVLPLLTAMTQGWAIGWASAPFDPYWAARYPRRAAVMAAAGPIGNLILAIIAFVLLKAGLTAGWFVAPASVSFGGLVESAGGVPSFVAALLSILLMLNVLLFTFNLLPLPPLDGSAVLGLVLPQSQAIALQQYTAQPWLQILGLAIAWKAFPLISGPRFALVLALLHPGESYR
jgi:Zn-dependent protease